MYHHYTLSYLSFTEDETLTEPDLDVQFDARFDVSANVTAGRVAWIIHLMIDLTKTNSTGVLFCSPSLSTAYEPYL